MDPSELTEPDTEYEVRVRGNNGHDDTISDWTDIGPRLHQPPQARRRHRAARRQRHSAGHVVGRDVAVGHRPRMTRCCTGTASTTSPRHRPRSPLAGAPNGSRGVWSDGTTVWVVPNTSGGDPLTKPGNSRCIDAELCVQAYDIVGGQRRGPKEIGVPVGDVTRALWSDGEILWVLAASDGARAFDLATGGRLSALDFTFVDEMTQTAEQRGAWSDGKRMWVTLGTTNLNPSKFESHVRVYPLDASVRMPADIALDLEVSASTLGSEFAAFNKAVGIWSDRETLWLSSSETDNDDGDKVLHAYVAARGRWRTRRRSSGRPGSRTTLDVEVAENNRGLHARIAARRRGRGPERSDAGRARRRRRCAVRHRRRRGGHPQEQRHLRLRVAHRRRRQQRLRA